jgi:hypothetical protein
LLAPAVAIRLVDDGQEWRGRGDDGIAELIKRLESREGGRQVRGDFYHGGSTYMAVLTHAGDDGALQHSVFVLALAGERVTNLTYHHLSGPG